MLAEQHDDWIEARRYLGLDVLAKARLTVVADTDTTEEVTDTDPKALSAKPTNGSRDTTATPPRWT